MAARKAAAKKKTATKKKASRRKTTAKASKANGNGKSLEIELPPLDIRFMELTVEGDSGLISHRWSEKAKKQMLDKQMGKANPGKEPKNPQKDYEESLYELEESTQRKKKYGFPAVAFKAAAVGACRFVSGIKMTEARGAFHVMGELVPIDGSPVMREDMVRIGQGTSDIRYRGEFRKWKAKFRVRYNANALTAEQITNLFNVAGFGVGVGEWRPEKNGSYGMFHVV
jgi:hypothetical protein